MIFAVMTQKQQVAVARNGSQQVVEIMRYSARQLTNCLHLLALDKLFFQRFKGRSVIQNGKNAGPAQINRPTQAYLHELFRIASPGA